MPLYMDVHIMPGINARDVAEAHRRDLLVQAAHECKCLTYWIDEERESIFCLIDAPAKEAVIEMHDQAHGLVPNKIIEVSSDLVSSFLGRIYDPVNIEISSEGLRIFSDPSFRILLVTKVTDPILLLHRSGKEKADEILEKHDQIIRRNIARHEGSEAEHAGCGFITSFTSAMKAVSCALAIQKEMLAFKQNLPGFTIGINAGVPVAKTNRLFGETIQLAGHLCAVAKDFQVAIASSVKELVPRDCVQNNGNGILTLRPQDENLLELLFNILEENFHDPDFDIGRYCHRMAMSKSQLYRKTIALTGLSPNLLLKDFRLGKAKDLMRRKRDNISQVTFDAGFSSPSYFTKCFKNKYGLLPMTYLDLL